jgi:GGDEF domain-containing protein
MNANKQNNFANTLGPVIGILLLTLIVSLSTISPGWFTGALLIAGAALVGFTIGTSCKNADSIQQSPVSDKHNSSTATTTQSSGNQPSDADNNSYIRGILDELSLMQNSNDLLNRYQCFIRMTEQVFDHAIGSCCVSLWCPDQNHQNLIECVIKNTNSRPSATMTGISEARPPCQVPLDLPAIKQALESGLPYLAAEPSSNGPITTNLPIGSLICDACIPLYRQYGRPLLINVEFTAGIPGQRKKTIKDDFRAAVNLINLFWKHLQATNQRQWMIEHEPISGVLRAESFLEQAQNMARQYQDRDELFTVVVVTVHGFRSMFAGQSQQWHLLSALIGRCLKKILDQKNRTFLLGKMADDVFALLLSHTDEFLAQSIMQTIADRLADEMAKDRTTDSLDVMAVDIQWALADQNQFPGHMGQMLDKIYRRLFIREKNRQNPTHRIFIDSEAAIHADRNK